MRQTVIVLACIAALCIAATSSAQAGCTPAAANNVTANCTGTTNNQGAGAPGTSADTNGYGTGNETGVTVNVASGAGTTVTGTNIGIYLSDGTVVNNTGATITGVATGFETFGAANVTNSGHISGNLGVVSISGDVTAINTVGATIASGSTGVYAIHGDVVLTNAGDITAASSGASGVGGMNVTATNTAGATIAGGFAGINASSALVLINSGSITGINNAGVTSIASATVTNNAGASIVGGSWGIFAGSGGSSVFNAGTISGTSNGAIRFSGNGNTLTLAPGSNISGLVLGTGSDLLQLGGNGAATFDVSQIDPAAQYRGFGTLNKIGASTWTLTGTSTFAGPVNVNAGTLSVVGDITSASGVTVNASGTLSGTGTVGNTTINGGAFAPGSGTPGSSMMVNGNLAFLSGAQYLVALNPATSSFAAVTGTAALGSGNASVGAAFAAGSYVVKKYMILTAGSVTGTFNPVVANTNLPAGFKTTLSYDPTHAYLDLALGFAAPPGGGLNGNQQKGANAIVGFFNSNGSIPIVFGGLTPAGLTQISGETATGSQQTTFGAMTQFIGVMTDPFIGSRGDMSDRGSSATAFADEGDRSAIDAATGNVRTPGERDAYAMLNKAPAADPFAQRWSVWAAGFGGSQTTDGNTTQGTNATTSRLAAAAVGADYRFSPYTIAGFALAGGGTNFSLNGFGNGRSDLFQAGAFLRHNVGPAYFTAALAYGWQDLTTDRTVTVAGIDQLRARFNANAFSGRIEDGYRFVTPWIGVTPYAAGQFTTFDLPAYAEQAIVGANTFALAYNAKTVTDARSEIGVRTDKSWAMPDSIFTLRGRFAWAHDYNTGRSIAATFQTLPGAGFVVNGAAQSPDKALTTASAEVKWRNGFSLVGTFEGEFSSNSRSYAGKGVARYQW